MSDERVWLRHKDTGHFFHCPAAAVGDWTTPDMGWEPTDERPEEVNPVTAEHLAWRAEQAAQQQPEKQPITATAGSAPESEE